MSRQSLTSWKSELGPLRFVIYFFVGLATLGLSCLTAVLGWAAFLWLMQQLGYARM